MTAVFVPGTTSRFVRSDVPDADGGSAPDAPAAPSERRQRRAPAFRPAGDPADGPSAPADQPGEGAVTERTVVGAVAGQPADEPDTAVVVEGYVLFQVGGTSFAVPVGEVREIVRAVRLELLPAASAAYGHGVALVDARGRSIPVVDLRSDRESEGDVLLPLWRHQVGLVVDRVTAVHTPRELAREHDDVPEALPSYARGVLRPVDGGPPVLLIALPDAAELDLDAARPDDQRLGHDVLAAVLPA